MTYEEVVEQILGTPKFSDGDTFSGTRELIRRLGNPQSAMKVIHIAGTNGKGSVSAFLSSMLVHGKKKCGLFTSPHLIDINERFQINQVPVSNDKLIRAYEEVRNASDSIISDGYAVPTFFDLFFAMAMVIFRDEKVEYAVLETGMGGKRDATNIVEQPIATVITTISLDHTEILGDTITKIAGEKAGIIKDNIPIIYDGRCEESQKVIERTAALKHAKAVSYTESLAQLIRFSDNGIDFKLRVPYYYTSLIEIPFIAPYQMVNSSLALIAMEEIDPEHEIDLETRLEGIRDTKWQGRMETVLPGVIVDGAHNEDGINEFVRTLKLARTRDNRKITLLFSAVKEKNYREMIRTICETYCIDEVVVTEIKGSRVVETKILAELFQEYTEVPVSGVEDLEKAFMEAMIKKENGILFCAGSLYLVGEIKRIIRRIETDD